MEDWGGEIQARVLTGMPLSQEPLFAARVIYDLLFFFMVIIIVLNLIFGVIIDTFADLRSEKQKKEEILKTTCFICGEWGAPLCPPLPFAPLSILPLLSIPQLCIDPCSPFPSSALPCSALFYSTLPYSALCGRPELNRGAR